MSRAFPSKLVRKFLRSRIFRWIQGGFLLAGGGFLGVELWRFRASVQELSTRVDPGLLAGSLVVVILGLGIFPAGIYWTAQQFGATIPWPSSLRIYFATQPSKYVPGGIWVYSSRTWLLDRAGLSIGTIARMTLSENLLLVGSSLLVGLPLFWWTPCRRLHPESGLVVMALLLAGFGGGVLIGAAWMGRRSGTDDGWAVRGLTSVVGKPAPLVWLLGSYLAMWVCLGAGFVVQAWALGIVNSTAQIPMLIWSFPLAWCVGFVTLVSPSGIGIREAVLIGLLAPQIGEASAVSLTVLARLEWVAGELMWIVAGWGWGWWDGSIVESAG